MAVLSIELDLSPEITKKERKMTKIYQEEILVNACKVCGWAGRSGNLSYCFNISKIIPDKNKIPLWCPLPDKGGKQG